jgi:hypothetical protein
LPPDRRAIEGPPTSRPREHPRSACRPTSRHTSRTGRGSRRQRQREGFAAAFDGSWRPQRALSGQAGLRRSGTADGACGDWRATPSRVALASASGSPSIVWAGVRKRPIGWSKSGSGACTICLMPRGRVGKLASFPAAGRRSSIHYSDRDSLLADAPMVAGTCRPGARACRLVPCTTSPPAACGRNRSRAPRGVTSRTVLEALERNGHGHLWSIDLPPPLAPALLRQTGIAVPGRLRAGWTYVRGSSRRRLPSLVTELEAIDVFIHDSVAGGTRWRPDPRRRCQPERRLRGLHRQARQESSRAPSSGSATMESAC